MLGIKQATAFALSALVFTAAVPLYAEDRMRAGLWEVVTTQNGEPSAAGINTCYTPVMVEFANRPAKIIREATEKSAVRSGCTLKEFRSDGNSISMVKLCGANSFAISSTYSGNAFETVDTRKEASGTKVIRMKGRRIGDCK